MLLAKRFEEQASKTPNKLSIVSDKCQYTFRELNFYANKIKDAILYEAMNKPINTDRISLFFSHDCDMIAAMLGVLKSGNTYVPIDPDYPKSRILHILINSDTELVLTDNKNYEKYKEIQKILHEENNIKTIVINIEQLKNNKSLDNNNLDVDYSSTENLGYILYTSGSTDEPKGVMQTQKNVEYFIENYIKNLKITEDDRLTLFSSYCHDASVMDIYSALFSGAALYIINLKETNTLGSLTERLNDNKITIWHSVPTVHRSYIRNSKDNDKVYSVRYIVLGGEEVISYDIKHFKSRFPNGTLYNLYGQTEASYSCGEFIYSNDYHGEITLGDIIEGTEVFIMNESGYETDVFEIGEIVIINGGISPGYWKNEEKTSEAFMEESGERLYFTGDLGKVLPNGKIKFEGRKDNQVKIRGYRVDIGEIESTLLSNEFINKAAVACKIDEHSEKYLVAFVVVKDDKKVKEVRNYLSSKLPDYMVPAYIVDLKEIPLTSTGKVNRKELMNFDIIKYRMKKNYEITAPRNEVEERVVEIFKEILNLDYDIGIDEDFFELGGHSLKATFLVSRIHKEFEVEIPLMEIFKVSTVEKISEIIGVSEKSIYDGIKSVEKREYYKMSAAQKRMYIINQMDKETTTYNMPSVLKLIGNLDRVKIENTFKELIKRHESLRTSFTTVEGELVQIVKEVSKVEFKVGYKEANKEDIKDIIKAFIRPFDLSKAPLLRVKLLKFMEDEYLIMVDMHHIISDGVSLRLVIEEFAKIYGGEEPEPLKVQYKDYAVWQNELFESEKIKKQEKYWLERFKGEIPVLNMQTDYQRSAVRSNKGTSNISIINKELTNKLNRLAKETGSTLYMILLSAVNILLWKYTGQEDIVIGSPIAGRHHNDLTNIVGMFVNTLTMRNYPRSDKVFRKFLKEVKENSLRAYDNQDIQFEELVDKLSIKRDISRNPLFDIMFVFQNTEVIEKNLDLEGLEISPYDLESDIAKFDITITATEIDRKISLNINYAVSLYKKSTIKRLANHFTNILEEISKNIDIKIKDIDILSEKEKHQLLVEFNDTESDYPKDKTIHQLFEEQVEKTPDNTAVIYEIENLTYKELNEKANQLARLLRNKGVKADSTVGIMLEKTPEMIISLIAVLKAGGAYVPIDINYPDDRINHMIEDSDLDIILTSKEIRNKSFINVDLIDVTDRSIYIKDYSNLNLINKPSDLAYVIYTSGSTGKPKGIMIEHNSVINYINFCKEYYLSNQKTDFPLFTSISFDLTVTSIYTPLLSGSTIRIYSDSEDLNDLITDKSNIIKLTPSHLKILNEIDIKECNIGKFIVGGEELTNELVEKIYSKFNNDIEIYNEYGPTEATVGCIVYKYEGIKTSEKTLPIGIPINNTKVYILDRHLNISPVGTAGELYISGAGLARGYLNRPKLTSEKFIENPFSPDKKMYGTGDLARWLSDGNIEFIGRIDDQVKIRGFRIELGEIESQFQKLSQIKESVVTVVGEEKDNKSICAYFVKEGDIDIPNIREELSKALPAYMMPSYFLEIDEIPLTINGKIDKKALPKPDGNISIGVEYAAPRNKAEKKLVQIFKEILDIDIEIGIKENFFELGGHSLKATILVSRIHKEFEVEIPLIEIFKVPTIEHLSRLIKVSEKSIYDEIKPVEKRKYYKMSAAQKRMYIINQMDKVSKTYNMLGVLKLTGNLDRMKIENTFKKLINRHESLRTSFTTVEDELVQIVKEVSEVEFKIEYREVNEEEIQDIVKTFIRSFDLSKSPLLRIGLLKLRKDEHILMTDMHHIISDRVSMGIVIEEFTKIYAGEELRPLKIQYKDYAVWQNELFKSGKIKEQEEYWLERFEGEIPVLNMQTDYKRPAVRSNKGASKNFVIDKKITTALNKIAKETGSTLYMVLLSAVNILLSKYTGQEDIVIGSPIAGRNHNDLTNIVGMFVNTLAMRNYPSSDKVFREFLREVKENSLRAYDNQDIQFEELVEKLTVKRDISRNPLFDIMFVLQNTAVNEKNLDLEGLEISAYDLENQIAKFDITITAIEINEEISLNINYATSLYKESTIERLVDHFTNVLKEISKDIDIKIKDIDILSEKEKHQLLVEFNDTESEYPKNRTIQQLFEEQVEKTPDNTAVVYEDESLTYKELNEKANSLARVLRDKCVKPDIIVGIMVERSLEMIVGILGILKAGGAYLPIDPTYPEERMNYMLEDSKVKILITNDDMKEKFEKHRVIINIENQELFEQDNSNLGVLNKSDNLAYIIYTSGSTGRPKGNMTMHYNVTRVVKNTNYIEIYDSDNILQLSNYAFDGSTFDIYGALLNGAKLVMVKKEILLNINELGSFIEDENITVFFVTTALFNTLVDINIKYLKNRRKILFGGERVSLKHTKKALNYVGKDKIIHVYGPTESTVYATYYHINKIDEKLGTVPIGTPLSNTQIYILDKNNNIVPSGVEGELCISGDGLAKGYLNRPELTKEKFVENPFIKGENIYKTGDLARWLPDGNIEFIGRIDNQVKIRGFRIELGEIESSLLKHKDVKEAVVMIRKDDNDDKYLCGYIVGKEELTIKDIREYLNKKLPDYMIPSYFAKLDKMPLTLNGKIDKNSLPEPQRLSISSKDYIGPRNKAEKLVEKGWRKVLDIKESISINENFFEIGGHSIALVKLVEHLKRAFKLEVLNLIHLYENPTIEGMAEFITSSEREDKIFYELTKELNPEAVIYGVPYIGGDASCYGALAREFDKQNIKVRIMSTSIFDIGNEIDGEKMTIEKFSQIRAKEIAEQGKENIYLLGHCGGSIIAVAIADELRKLKVKIEGMILCGLVPIREPNKVILAAAKRTKFRQAVTNLRNAGFIDRLSIDIIRHFQKTLIELSEFRYKRRKKINYRVFKHTTTIYNIIADRDPVTYNHKRGHKKWRKFSFNVQHVVIKGKSHYFISRNADKVTSEINKIIEVNREEKYNQKKLIRKDSDKKDKAISESSN